LYSAKPQGNKEGFNSVNNFVVDSQMMQSVKDFVSPQVDKEAAFTVKGYKTPSMVNLKNMHV